MTIERLISDGSIHAFRATPGEIGRAMSIARRDLALAESILEESLDWSYSIAYNAVLQTSRAYMFHLGYRPSATESHKTTMEFLRLSVDEWLKGTVAYFDRVRVKRHRTLYDEAGLVTEKEARQLLEKAGEFVDYVSEKLSG